MKRFIGLTGAAVLALALLGPGATAGKGAHQHVEGDILMMAPFVSEAEQLQSCYAGVHRRLSLVGGEQVQGIVGWHFEVDPGTYNKKFKLDVTAGSAIDLDLTFYLSGLGSIEDHANNPPYGSTLPVVNFEERDDKGEKGIVPKDATHAIVCMFEGQNASFSYMAGKGVK